MDKAIEAAAMALARGGDYDRFRHDNGEPVHIEVIWD